MTTQVINQAPSRSNSTKQRLSLFSFGSDENTPIEQQQQQQQQSPPKSQSQSQQQQPKSSASSTKSSTTNSKNKNSKSNAASIIETDESCIFERSVQDSCCCFFEPNRSGSIVSLSNSIYNGNSNNNNTTNNNNTSNTSSFNPDFKRSRSSTHNSQISLGLSTYKHEDLIPPALDATAHLFNDKQTDLENVEMIYSSRRNSSVSALNMALGRPMSPISRNNSIYSSIPIMSAIQPNTNDSSNTNNNASTSPSSLQSSSEQQQPAQTIEETTTPKNLPSSPLSPPQLKHSKSSVNFYSYAEMCSDENLNFSSTFNNSPSNSNSNSNNSSFIRRPPQLRSSYSQGIIPTFKSNMQKRNNSLNYSKNKNVGGNGNNQSSSNLSKVLLSPDLDDDKDKKKISV
ncbi:VHS2 [Candida pseudojiufengensis]|uniref:VHS2 n=1 Tax=Candida pseudojiufengensis TaxID=497109 RepID=UPI0022259564|nr:VHS2 [Candida pseudojiufengensis]KAI5962232.1 VHS2 [Candida pseudojiufengensis]